MGVIEERLPISKFKSNQKSNFQRISSENYSKLKKKIIALMKLFINLDIL